MKALKKVSTKVADLNKVQENVEAALTPIIACPLVNGLVLKNVELVSGQDNIVAHKLQRRPQGWFVVSPKQSATVWELTSALPASNLNLRCSANVTLDLWVF